MDVLAPRAIGLDGEDRTVRLDQGALGMAPHDEFAHLGAVAQADDNQRGVDLQRNAGLPAAASPYFLSAGQGEWLVSYQTTFTYLSRPANTRSNYFAVDTKGAKSPYIPLHFHEQHTENFLCTEGRMWIYTNGRDVLLTKGDFLHAPAGTITLGGWRVPSGG